MKKLLVLSLAMSFVLSSSLSVFAEMRGEDIEYKNLIQEIEGEDFYAGSYFVGDELHIVPTEENDLKSVFKNRNSSSFDIVIDEPQRYSYNALEDAFLTLRANRDKLGVSGYSIDVINNGLFVDAYNWTDEMKEEIKNITNIENITFRTDEGVIAENIAQDSGLDDSLNDTRAIEKARLGLGIEIDQNKGVNNAKASIGGTVKNGSSLGILSTAHGVNKGEKVYAFDVLNGSSVRGYIGTITELRMKGNMDAVIIKLDNNSALTPTSLTTKDDWIDSQGFAVDGKEGYILGSRSKAPYIITNARADLNWNDPDHDDVQWYEDMIEMKFTTSNQTTGGDSGGAIIRTYTSGNGALAGIYKGRRTIGGTVTAYGTRFDSIEDYYGIEMYQEK